MNKPHLVVISLVLAAGYCFLSPYKPLAAPVDRESESYKAWRAALAQRRKVQLERLHEYAGRGEFPLNTGFSGAMVPYFIDREGTPCAVAHLIIASGDRELAESVARADNHVRVAQIKDGPVLDWILGSGLLQEEAALIQPSYGFMHTGERERLAERVRVRRHLREVEKTLRADNERSLERATERLLNRLERDPELAQRLKAPLAGRELPPRFLAPRVR